MDEIVFWIKHNPTPSLLGAGLLVSLILSAGNISKNIEASNQVKQVVAENSLKNQKAIAATDFEKEQAEIAESRYASGCLPVFTGQKINTFSSLIEGQPVVDRYRRKALPDGTVVCDANGNTGQIQHGKVSAVAYTGNKKVIALVTKHYSARYYVPTHP